MIIEYNEKYIEEVKDLMVELEEYIVSIDKDNLDIVSEEYREKYVDYMLEDVRKNNGKVLLALENEKVVGIIVGTIKEYSDWDHLDYKCPKTGNISELVVTKNSRAKGTGKKLIAEMEKYFKDCGCEYVYLDVFAYNENAIKFYNKNNYHARMHGLIKKID